MEDFKTITTYTQIHYYLDMGETVIFHLADGFGALFKDGKEYVVMLQQNLHEAVEYSAPESKVKQFVEQAQGLGVKEYYIQEGFRLVKRDASLIAKILSKIDKQK